jgi:hypothetical protein
LSILLCQQVIQHLGDLRSVGGICSIEAAAGTADRSRFFQIAYGSALECAAIIDVLFACKVIQLADCEKGKNYLNQIVDDTQRA